MKHTIIYRLLSVLFLFQISTSLIAQTGIMHLADNNFNTYFNTGIELKNDLFAQDNSGEATFEFWIKSAQSGNDWVLTDLNTDTDHFSVSMANENKLTLKLGSQNTLIDLGNEVGHDLWHHIALTFSASAQIMEAYVNGVKKGQVSLPIGTTNKRNLYFLKKANTELLMTELRGWSKKRTAEQIAGNQWRTLVTQSPSGLTALKSEQGLKVLYGNDDESTTAVPGINRLKKTAWKNMQSSTYDADCISGYDDNGDGNYNTLASIRTDVEHPILNLDEIMLTASKGKFSDNVQLAWLHIKDVDGYNIYRNDQLIGNLPAAGLNISDNIISDEANVLPSEIYTYKVTGYNNGDQNFYREGTSRGFIFPNGEITGNIKTESEVFVGQVEVTASPTQLPGSALKFDPGDIPITVNSVETFRNLNDFTIEFWYKADAGLAGTPFRLGSAQIAFDNTGLQVKNGNGANYISTPVQTDNAWHHYSVVFSASGGRVYEDGTLLQSNNTSFSIDLSAKNFFTLNSVSPVASYRLDEFRVWDNTRSDEEIATRYTHSISGHEAGLALYYRFDLGDTRYIYNQATATRGSYTGESAANLEWLAANEQPSVLEYGAFTNDQGDYTLTQVNAGTNPNGLSFTVTPGKPNHLFNPATRQEVIKSSLLATDYEKIADFIDISSLPIAGKVLYKIGEDIYPVPADQSIEVDGQVQNGGDPGVVTDAFGVFSVSAPLGLHEVSVHNPLVIQSMGAQSLHFDGADDYAETENVINFQQDATWSGWIKRGSSAATLQTILQIGDLRIVLKNNNTLVVMEGAQEKTTASAPLTDDWHFFALSYKHATKEVVLYSGISYKTGTLNTSPNGKLTLGATLSNGQPADFYEGNLHLVEYRSSAYSNTQIEDLRLGDYIADDASSLQFSFRFQEDVSNTLRSVSLAPNAQDYVLNLAGATIDAQAINPYTRKTKYDYHAEGVYAQGEKQVFNVVDPVTDLRFYNDTRYGVTGNIVIPCGYNIGAWDVKVERTDVASPKFELNYTGNNVDVLFNDDYTVFSVGGLLPGQYQILLTNQADPQITLPSGTLDITQEWVIREFSHRSPMSFDVAVIAVVDSVQQIETDKQPLLSLKTTPYDMNNYCTGNYIMESGKGYVLKLDTYEQYGQNQCFVKGVEYDLGESQDLAHIVAITPGTGQDTLLIKVLGPNFLNPYTRSLTVTASHDGRNEPGTINAYVTGAKQFNTNFTLEAPPNIVAVVHDPPGDGSSASLSKGTSFSFSESITDLGGADISIDVSTGVDMEHYAGVFVGLGGGTILLNKVVDANAQNLFQVAESFKVGGTDSKNYEVNLNQVITTSSSPTLPGYPSDVFVGYSSIIHMGTGKRLRMDGCTAIPEDQIDVVRPDRKPLFSLTHQHVNDVTIPSLEQLKAATNNTDSIQMYQSHIDGWRAILDDNIAQWEKAENNPNFELRNTETDDVLSFESSIAFSAGQSISYSLSDRNADGSGFIAESNTSLSTTFSTQFSIFNAQATLKTNAKGFYNYSENNNHVTTNGKNFGFTLTDDDIGDQFDVLIRKDTAHAFATPLFRAVSGQSMCPAERGTQPREGVEIVSDKSLGFADLDEQAIFNITLRNTQAANEAANNGYYKNYKLKVFDQKGTIVRYNGGLLSESGQLIVLDTQGPTAIKEGILTIERNPNNPEVEFEDIAVVFYSACEESGGSLGFYDGFGDVNLVDTLYLSAEFHRPCVEAITLLEPTENWVVNSSDNNELTLKFTIDNPEASFDNLLVEYANQGNNTPLLLQEVDPSSLTPDLSGDYTLTVDVSGITDGAYQFRLTPQCGIGAEPWRSETPSAWVSGSIYRIAPVITGVYPAENTIMTTGTISASYDRPLDPSGVNSLNVSLRERNFKKISVGNDVT